MGTIRGDLSVLGIANLLQSLHLGKCEGHLSVEGSSLSKVFYLHPGGLRLVSGSRRCQRLEKLLRRVGPVVTNRGAIGHLVREWLLDEMGEIFGWTRGTFRFQEGPDLPKGVSALPFVAESDVDVMTTILEASRRLDDLPRIRALLPDFDAVLERTMPDGEIHDPVIDPEVLRDVLPLVDGTRSVSQIVQASAFPRLSVLPALHRLAMQGALAIRVAEAA